MKPISQTAHIMPGQYVMHGSELGIVAEIHGEQAAANVVRLPGLCSGGNAKLDVLLPGRLVRQIPEAIIRSSPWSLLDKIATPEEIAAARAEYEAAHAAAKKASEAAAIAREERKAECLAEYSGFLEPEAGSKKTSQALGAANIRKELRKAFPGIKFRVRSDSFSMGNSIDVDWAMGPTAAEVREITSKYQEGHFDGMQDLYEYDRENVFCDLFGGAKYVSETREIPKESAETVKAALLPSLGESITCDPYEVERLVYKVMRETSFPPGAIVSGVEWVTDPGCEHTGHHRATYRLEGEEPAPEAPDEPAPAAEPESEAEIPETVDILASPETFAEFTEIPTLPADFIQGLAPDFAEQVSAALEERNAHSENLVFRAKRSGRPEWIAEAVALHSAHMEAGHFPAELRSRRDALLESMNPTPPLPSLPAELLETLEQAFCAVHSFAHDERIPEAGRRTYGKLAERILAYLS